MPPQSLKRLAEEAANYYEEKENASSSSSSTTTSLHHPQPWSLGPAPSNPSSNEHGLLFRPHTSLAVQKQPQLLGSSPFAFSTVCDELFPSLLGPGDAASSSLSLGDAAFLTPPMTPQQHPRKFSLCPESANSAASQQQQHHPVALLVNPMLADFEPDWVSYTRQTEEKHDEDEEDVNYNASANPSHQSGYTSTSAYYYVQTPGYSAPSYHLNRQCHNCKTAVTPFWRKAPVELGAPCGSYLCNACGLYFRAHKRLRPLVGPVAPTQSPTSGSPSTLPSNPMFNPHLAPRPATFCSACGSSETPLWRRDLQNRVVCNACGLRERHRRRSRSLCSAIPTAMSNQALQASFAQANARFYSASMPIPENDNEGNHHREAI